MNTIRSWWENTGSSSYPAAKRLLITADGGGSNGSRTRLWKTELTRHDWHGDWNYTLNPEHTN